MKKTAATKMKGVVALVIGLIVGVAYLVKWFPFDPYRHLNIVTVWSCTGWMFATIIILYGLCVIFLEDDSE